jgi:hypothetical protein
MEKLLNIEQFFIKISSKSKLHMIGEFGHNISIIQKLFKSTI